MAKRSFMYFFAMYVCLVQPLFCGNENLNSSCSDVITCSESTIHYTSQKYKPTTAIALPAVNNGNGTSLFTGTDPLEVLFNNLVYPQDIYLIPVICPIGIVGNGLVAVNLFAKRTLNSSFIYIVFILIADILSLISDLFLPLARILQLIPSQAIYVAAVGIYFWNMDILSYLFRRFSLNIFCVLSYERLTAIKKPLQLSQCYTVKHAHIFILLSFIVSFLATIVTPFFTQMVIIYDTKTNTTTYARGYTNLYISNQQYCDVAMIIVRFLDGPVQVLFFSVINGMIIRELYKNKQSLVLIKQKDRTKSISKLQTRLCKIFLILSVTNIFAFFPNSILIIVAKIFPESGLNIKSNTLKLLVFGGTILRAVNSSTNFIVFLFVSKNIRDEIKSKIFCQDKAKERIIVNTVRSD